MGWRPGAYKAERALQMPHADVPEFLRTELIEWVTNRVSTDNERMRAVLLYLQIRSQRSSDHRTAEGVVLQQLELLRSVEYILEMWPDFGALTSRRPAGENASGTQSVQIASATCGSTVRGGSGPAGRREGREHGVRAPDDAWNAAYGRTSDPVKAYDEAIRAVEAAFRPIVTPQTTSRL